MVNRICRSRVNGEKDEEDDNEDKWCHPGVFEGIVPPSADQGLRFTSFRKGLFAILLSLCLLDIKMDA